MLNVLLPNALLWGYGWGYVCYATAQASAREMLALAFGNGFGLGHFFVEAQVLFGIVLFLMSSRALTHHGHVAEALVRHYHRRHQVGERGTDGGDGDAHYRSGDLGEVAECLWW